MRREKDRRRRADSLGLRRDRQPGPAGRNRRGGAPVQPAPDGPEHLRVLLHAQESLRDLLHALRRQGQGGAVLAKRRRRDGDRRLQPLGQDGRVGDRRPGQQIGYRRGRPAALLRAGRRHPGDRDALRGPQRWPRLCRSRRAGLEEKPVVALKAGRTAMGARAARSHTAALAGNDRVYEDVLRAKRRGARAQPQRHAGVRAMPADSAHAQGRERADHHRRRRLGRAAGRRLHRLRSCN